MPRPREREPADALAAEIGEPGRGVGVLPVGAQRVGVVGAAGAGGDIDVAYAPREARAVERIEVFEAGLRDACVGRNVLVEPAPRAGEVARQGLMEIPGAGVAVVAALLAVVGERVRCEDERGEGAR